MRCRTAVCCRHVPADVCRCRRVVCAGLLFLPLSATTALLAQVAPKWKSDAPGYGVGALCSATLFFHSKFPTLPVWQRGLCSVGTAVGIAGARAFYERRMPELVD